LPATHPASNSRTISETGRPSSAALTLTALCSASVHFTVMRLSLSIASLPVYRCKHLHSHYIRSQAYVKRLDRAVLCSCQSARFYSATRMLCLSCLSAVSGWQVWQVWQLALPLFLLPLPLSRSSTAKVIKTIGEPAILAIVVTLHPLS
jgi:hypothetical protein